MGDVKIDLKETGCGLDSSGSESRVMAGSFERWKIHSGSKKWGI
jgi:hypothetical protein